MSLSGAQYKTLQDALLQEFPDLEHLRHWVRWGLNRNLAEYAHTDTLGNAVFDIIQDAVARGTLPALLDAAIRAAPQNAALRAVATELGIAVDVPVDALSTMPPL